MLVHFLFYLHFGFTIFCVCPWKGVYVSRFWWRKNFQLINGQPWSQHSLALDRSLQKSVSSVEPVLTLGPASFPVLLQGSSKKASVTVLTLRGGYLGVTKRNEQNASVLDCSVLGVGLGCHYHLGFGSLVSMYASSRRTSGF